MSEEHGTHAVGTSVPRDYFPIVDTELSAQRIPTSSHHRQAVFLDRDGTLLSGRHIYVTSPDQIEFLPTVLYGLRLLAREDVAVVIASNQSPVGRGLLTRAEALRINRIVVERIRDVGGRVDASYLCPHIASDACACRKPLPGMLLTAAQDLNLLLRKSYFIGDAAIDDAAAIAAGVQPVRVCASSEESKALAPSASTFLDAVRWVLDHRHCSCP